MEQPAARTEDEGAQEAQYRSKLYGESIRELGVLLLVFVPLETLLRGGPYNLVISSLGVLFGLGLTVYGAQVEARAEKRK